MVEKQRGPLQRDGVFRWFSELSSSQRVEFLVGLLDLCLPLELRFLGSCLEDLARKDYHSLRDSEIRANNAADLGGLTNLADELVRSRLLVSLALLSSDNRGAAGALCRTLTHIHSIINNLGLQLNDGRTGDEFLLLFTMATHHPAFSFHQRQLLRKELAHLQGRGSAGAGPPGGGGGGSSPPTATTTTVSSSNSRGCPKMTPRTEPLMMGSSLASALRSSAHSMDDPKRPSGKHCKVNVEKIEVKILPQKEKNGECCYQVFWSDSSVSLVTKSSAEVTEFISKVSRVFSEDLEKSIPFRGGVDSYSVDPDVDHRCLASLPPQVLKSDLMKKFFSPSAGPHQHQSLSPINPSHVKVSTPVGPSIRPICGVASIQSSHSSLALHHGGATMSMCPSPVTYRPPAEPASSSGVPTSVPSPQTQEQQDILEWLRKLRLHKYYTVFSQLSMKKFLSLTEEDLNKFESLTMGAKKKLKTQLELEKEKSEKRCLTAAALCAFTSSGVARVPPTSHVGAGHNLHCSHSTELLVDVESAASQMPLEGSSSSEYSSSPSSPMGLQTREESSDSAEEMDRRVGRPPECSEKDKSVLLVNHFTSGSVRPTAQVLPVQNDSGPCSHHPVALQLLAGAPSHIAPLHLINTLHKAERGSADMKILQSHPLLPPEERGKAAPAPRTGMKMGSTHLDVKAGPAPPALPLLPDSGGALQQTVSFGVRTKVGNPLSGDGSAPSSVPSTPVFHVTRTPVKLLVSSSDSPGGASVPPAIINPRSVLYTANTKVAFSALSGMPVGQLPGNFCANSSSSAPCSTHSVTSLPPSSSPASTSDNSYYSAPSVPISSQSSGHHHHQVPHHHHPPQQQAQAGCTVCSSCGCSGSCGSSGVALNYGNYFQHQFSAPSMFPFSLMPFSPLCNNGYLNPQQYSSSSAPFPVLHPPYSNTDSMLTGQPGFSLPPMHNFITGTAGVYQPQGMMGTMNGTTHKKSGNISCYNCGVSGHRAQDCKQPSMDFNQQGTFRLKFAPPSDGLDSAD